MKKIFVVLALVAAFVAGSVAVTAVSGKPEVKACDTTPCG